MARTMVVRKAAALTLALVGLACAFIAGTGAAAVATQGSPVIAGVINSENNPTTLNNGGADGGLLGDGLDAYANGTPGSSGVWADGPIAVFGHGKSVGVQGQGITGVYAQSTGAGDGVSGRANNACCSAVFGQNSGTGNGVAGQADTGTGVLAASTNGTALKVAGRAQFSLSGTATITGSTTTPKSSIVVNNVALTTKSLVLVTAQKNVAGVWVQAAVPSVANSRITIFLNKTVAVPYPVAWFIVQQP
jgi:hypothetical protein